MSSFAEFTNNYLGNSSGSTSKKQKKLSFGDFTNNYLAQKESRTDYGVAKYNELVSAYRQATDSASKDNGKWHEKSYYSNQSQYLSGLENKRKELENYFKNNSQKYSADFLAEMDKNIKNLSKTGIALQQNNDSVSDYYSSWEDEETYNRDYDNYTYSNKYNGKTYSDLLEARELTKQKAIKATGNELDVLNRELNWLNNHKTDKQFADTMTNDELIQYKEDYENKVKTLKDTIGNLNTEKLAHERGGQTYSERYKTVVKDLESAEKELATLENNNGGVLYYDEVGAVTTDTLLKMRENESVLSKINSDEKTKTAYEKALEASKQLVRVQNAINAEKILSQETIEESKRLNAIIDEFEALGYNFDSLKHYEEWKTDRDNYAQTQAENMKYASEHPVLATVESILTAPFTPFELADNMSDAKQYGLSNIYDDKIGMQNETYQGTVSKLIEDAVYNKTDSEVLSWLASTAYSGVTSASQSALTTAACTFMFGGAGANVALAVMGTEAAASSYRTAISNGSSNEQAILTSVTAGVGEALFEKIPLDNLLRLGKNASKETLVGVLKSIAKQGFLEGLEEGGTEIWNTLADGLINGDRSAYNTSVRQYELQGYSIEEAVKKANSDWLNNLLSSVVGGFAGGISTGGVTGTGYAIGKVQENQNIKNTGKLISATGGVNDLLTNAKGLEGLSEKETKTINKLTSKIEGKTNANEHISSTDARYVGKLFNLVSEKQTENTRNLVKEELKSHNADTSAETVDVLLKYAQGEKLTEAEQTVFDENKGVYVLENIEHKMAQKSTKPTAETVDGVNADTFEGTTENAVENDFKQTTYNGEAISFKYKSADAVELDNGETVSVEDITMSDDDAVFYDAIMGENDIFPEARFVNGKLTSGVNISTANEIRKIFGGTPTINQLKGVQMYYNYGMYNIKRFGESGALTEAQEKQVFNLGRAFGRDVAEKESSTPKVKKYSKGKVKYNVKSELSSRQQASVEVIEKLADMFNITFNLYESTLNENGERLSVMPNGEKTSANGYYMNGEIYVDINAGNNGQGAVLYTVAHELTHYIREWSPKKFKVLADFLVEQYESKGKSVDYYINKQMEKARKSGNNNMKYSEAFEEFVADSMEKMLTDQNAVEKLVALRTKDKSVFDKLREGIQKLVDRIKQEYAKLTPDSAEGRTVATMTDVFSDIQDLFLEALDDASNNFQKAEKNTATNDGAKMQIRNNKYSYDYLISKDDMVVEELAYVTESEIQLYKKDKDLFAKDMRKNALQKGNKKNTQTATYLYCKDLNADVQITRDSFKHGAARMDGAYISVCKSIAEVLQNSIVVNELNERKGTNGGFVLLALTENADSYVIVRSIINKKTWKLEDYNELYAIKKKSIKKEDVGFEPPYFIQTNGYGTSSTISISNFLKIVNNQSLGNSVLSLDVVENLESKRGYDENITPSLKFSNRDSREFNSTAIEHFGRTFSWKETGYLLTNGAKLDFSGKNMGAPGGRRTLDHRDIIDIYSEEEQDKLSGTDAMIDFMSYGNIRISPETNGINLSVAPTKAQEEALEDYISRNARGEITLDIDDLSGSTLISVEYPRNTRASKIINDIRQYFKDGTEPYVSDLAQFRFSERGQSVYKLLGENQRLQKENERLKEKVKYLNDFVKLQRKITHGKIIDRRSTEAQARKIKKSTGSKIELSNLTDQLYAFYTLIISGSEDLVWDTVLTRASWIANDILNEVPESNQRDEYAQEILSYIRSKNIRLNDVQRAEVENIYDSYNAYRKRLMGSITISQSGTSLDSVWQDLAEQYPDTFSKDTNPADMPLELADIIHTLRNSYEVIEKFDKTEQVRWLAEQIYDTYWDVSTVESVMDKLSKEHQQQINELKMQHAERVKKIYAKHQEDLKDQKAYYQEMYKRLRERATASHKKQMLDYQDKVHEAQAKAIEKRNNTARRQQVLKFKNSLETRLLKDHKEKNIPLELQPWVCDFLIGINFDNVGAENRLANLAAEMEKTKNPQVLNELQGRYERIKQRGEKESDELHSKKGQYFAKRKEAIDNIREAGLSGLVDDNELVAEINQSINADIRNTLAELRNIVGNKSMRDLNSYELECLYQSMKIVDAYIRSQKEVFIDGKKQETETVANNVANEILQYSKNKLVRKSVAKIKETAWTVLKPKTAFDMIGSETLIKVLDLTREGESKFATNISNAQQFYLETYKKHKADDWNFEEQHTFHVEGEDVSLTLGEIMSMYNYSKREQAIPHLTGGGFTQVKPVTKKVAKLFKVEYELTRDHGIRANEAEIGAIINSLSAEQKKFCDDLQEYLSTVMGALGNEVSRELYQINLYKEKYYWPLKSSSDFQRIHVQENEKVLKLRKNEGFSNATVKKANNPVVLESVEKVFADHVVHMSGYNAYTIGAETMRRVFGYVSFEYSSVRAVVGKVYGKGAVDYLNHFIQDLNGGRNKADSMWLPTNLVSTFKKVTVGASMSTVVQQPTALIRAMALIKPKHFGKSKVDSNSLKANWEELKKYAPVAVMKEIGGYDMSVGVNVAEFVTQKEYSTIKEKGKALITDKRYRDDLAMWGAAKADELSWATLWRAVKNEQHYRFPNMEKEKFLKICGKRFTDIVYQTQVYDSIFSRAEIMRSTSEFNKMATSFMGEPLTSLNILVDSILQVKRGKITTTQAKWNISTVVFSQIVAAAMASVIYAMRDDDEDESYWEKYVSSFSGNVVDQINPLTWVPYLRDVYSMIKGYSVERTDMAVISDLITSVTDIWHNDKITPYEKTKHILLNTANCFGIPAKNVNRELNALTNMYKMIIDDNVAKPGDGAKAFAEGIIGEKKMVDANEYLSKGKTEKVNKLINDLLEEKTEKNISNGKTPEKAEKDAKSSIRSSLTSYWKPLFIEAYQEDDYIEQEEIYERLHSTGIYGTTEELKATIEKWVKDLQ